MKPEADEVLFEGDLSKVNGWEAGQLGQQMGRDFRERLQPGWRVKSAKLVLSVRLERTEEEPTPNEA